MFVTTASFSQVAISENANATADESAILDLQSINKGILLPKISLESNMDTLTIRNPEKGLLIYNVPSESYNVEGFLYWDGNVWRKIEDNLEKERFAEAVEAEPEFSHAAYAGSYKKQDFTNGIKLGDFCFKISRNASGDDSNLTASTPAHDVTSFYIKYTGEESSKRILFKNLITYDQYSRMSNHSYVDCTSDWKSLGDMYMYTFSSAGSSNIEKRICIFTSDNFNDKYFYRLEYQISGDYLNSDAKIFIYIERIAMQ
jgi:hypothetical protein